MDLLGLSSARPILGDCAARAGHELGLYRALAHARPDGETAAGLAATVGASPRRLAALLDVLALDGWLARDGAGRARASARYRLRATPPLVEVVREGWGRLADVLRADRPLDEPGVAGAASEALERFHAHLAIAARDPARELFTRLREGRGNDEEAPRALDPSRPPDDRPPPPSRDLAPSPLSRARPATLLDLGAGSGAWSAAFLDGDRASRATLVDRADVLAIARRRIDPARTRLVAGDLFEAPLGEGHAIALLAHVLHLFSPSDCARLVARAAASLAPGGRLVVVDLAIATDRASPPLGVYFALNMALYTDGGDVHDGETIAEFLVAAGLVMRAPIPLACAPDLHVLVGARPA